MKKIYLNLYKILKTIKIGKTRFIIPLLGFFFVLIMSCQKEVGLQNIQKEEVIKNSDFSTNYVYGLDKVPNNINKHSIDNYVLNNEDADDEKINKYLLEIGVATRELLKDCPMNREILESSVKIVNSVKPLLELVDQTKLKPSKSINEKAENLLQVLRNADLTHKSTNPLRGGEIEDYIPVIYVPNAEIADPEKQPIIGLGFQVNPKLEGMEEYEDCIVAWYYDGYGVLHEILLNEETAISTTNPVYIIDIAEEEASKMLKSQVHNGVAPLNTKSTTAYHSNEYKINNRYETTWANSEFCITGAHITETGSVQLICKEDNGTYNSWKKIAEVNKNDVGKQLSHWEQFCSNEISPFNTNYVFWNTYERDWMNSSKDLGSATKNGSTIYLYGNRKYSGDWYAYDPTLLQNNPVDFNTIYNSWANWYSNDRGNYRIWRVEL